MNTQNYSTVNQMIKDFERGIKHLVYKNLDEKEQMIKSLVTTKKNRGLDDAK